MLTLWVLLALAILAAAAASAAEVALFALPHEQIQELVKRSGIRGKLLARLRDHPLRLLTSVWAVRIAATVGAAIAVWEISHRGFAVGGALAFSAALVTVLPLIVVQLMARTLAVRVAEPLALSAALPCWFISQLLFPIAWPARAIVRALSPGTEEALPRITDREIRDLVGSGNGEPQIEEHERRLIQRAFLLDQTTAYDAMTPRVDVFAWPEMYSLAKIAPELRAVRYSRVPLYGESIDKITGILYVRDAYQALISGQEDVEVKTLAREPLLVPGSLTLDKLLLDFQSRRMHMGIVIDEYGGTDGLITLEDILEELVGEIVDETDVAEESIIRLGRNDLLVDGGADLREINHFFNTAFPLLEHRSFNGYLLDLLGRVPQSGEKIIQEGVIIEVHEATDTQVVRARLTRASREAEPPPHLVDTDNGGHAPSGDAPDAPTLREQGSSD
jgi:CBS domain containing-hemolysin-like protein